MNCIADPARRRVVYVALLAVLASALPLRTAGAATPDFASLRRDRPYVPLFTEAGNCAENRTANNLAPADLDTRLTQLTRWFTHFHGEASAQLLLGDACRGASATTLAGKLSARGAWVSNYRNGSYVSQASATQPLNFGEAADLESKAPLSIATFWPGNAKPNTAGDDNSTVARLSGSLDTATTTVRVASAAANRPAGAPTTWPFVNSRGTGLSAGAHSTSTRDFVSWVRLDDEIAQIVSDPVESGGVVTLTVRRGIWGTAAAAHASTARVMSPIYIGNTNAAASDSNLAGGPNRNDANYPLRYAIKIWQPGGYNWIADRIKATFGPGLQGYNSVWLDVSSCAQYNHADASGQPVFGWDDPAGTKLTRTRWGVHQKEKLAGLRAALPGVRFTGNSLSGLVDACTDDLMANAYDGGVLENWMKADAGHPLDWATSMAQSYRIQAGNWPALYWVRWNYDFTGDPTQYQRFSYASLLLAYRTSADRFQYGGAFGLAQPDDLYFWDWGAPRTNPGGTAEVKVAGTELYRRDFANGMVLVNPSAGPITYDLGGRYYDVVHRDGSGNPSPVTSVTVPAKDAAFLLGTPVPADTQAPTVTVSSPTAGSNLSPGPVTVSGSATDDTGVTAVEVGIQQAATGQWWHADGTWGAYQSQPATVDAPSAPGVSWRYIWSPPGDATYAVLVSARDDAGNTGSPPAVTFSVTTPPPADTQAPDTSVNHPPGTFSAKPVRLSGGATDNAGVSSVRVAVRNTVTGKWWHQDGTWGAFASSPATVTGTGTAVSWAFSWNPPGSGSFGVSAIAFDATGNGDPSGAWAIFKVSGGKVSYP